MFVSLMCSREEWRSVIIMERGRNGVRVKIKIDPWKLKKKGRQLATLLSHLYWYGFLWQ